MKRFLLISFMLLGSMKVFSQADTVIVGGGCKYVGQYPEGKGVLYSGSTGIYIGQFEKTKPHGIGTYYGKDGSKYHGMFREGKPDGYGRRDSSNGDIFVGDFKNGLPNGTDTIYYASGRIYVGTCEDGLPHGRGKLYSYKRKVISMQQGEFVKGTKLDKGWSQTFQSAPPFYRKGPQEMQEYNTLAGSLSKIFPGAPLTKKQKNFLKK